MDDDTHNIKVVAGPGSGKTTLILEKVHKLVKKGVKPNRILIITYTNKAAKDLERKISKKIKEKGFYVSTVHGFCTRFMREYPIYFKNYKGFRVLDELGQLLFIVKWNKSIRTEETGRIEPLKLRNYFGRIKDNYSKDIFRKIEHAIKKSYFSYCSKLNEEKRMDFGDLINTVIEAISTNKPLQEIAKEKFDYIFIDEYQDINRNQEELVKLFLKTETKLMVVGDKNQSIYGFRGSDVRIFDNFEKSFTNTKTYNLMKNYRSNWKIINLSNKFLGLTDKNGIIGNRDKGDGGLTKEGPKVTIKEYPDELCEATETIRYIKKLKDEKTITNYSDVAILLRSVKGDSKRFIKAMEEMGIPYEVIGDGGLFELDYIKEVLNCFCQLSEKDSIKNDLLGIDFERIDIMDIIPKGPLAIFYKLIEKSKYFQEAILNNEESKLFNLGKFSRIISTYCENFNFDRNGKYLLTFYQNITRIEPEFLDTEQPKNEFDNSVKILTLHKAKGLEFPLVVIPGVNKGKYKIKNGDFISDLFKYYDPKEDMQRAFYVAITRAKQKLIISYFDNPSDYIAQLITNQSIIFFEKHNQARLFDKNQEELELMSSQPEKEVLELTYYKLIEFWKCPFAYKLRFHYDLLIPRTFMFTYGSTLHTLLYHLNLAIKNNSSYDISRLILEKVPNPLLKFNFKLLLENYLSEFKNELNQIIAIEKPFEFSLGESIINGRMDLVVKNKDGKYAIIEFKSGTWSEEKEVQTKKQINLYALSQDENEVTEGIIYFFGTSGKRVDFKINKKQTELEIYAAISKIRNRDFIQNNQKCEDCVFNDYPICPYNAFKDKSYQKIRDSDAEDDEKQDFCCEV